jgi:DNA-binding NtrC family response regulator
LDLFHRINTIVINLPPLRERKEDIPLLAQYFLKKYGCVETLRYTQGDSPDEYRDHSEGVPIKSGRPKNLVEITPSALNLLVNYNWPGNIRELENEIKRICALYQDISVIIPEMISKNITNYAITDSSEISEAKMTIKELTDDFHRKIIKESLEKNKNNMAKTAKSLGYSWVGLYKRMKQLNISAKAK